ncbi:MAG: PH domain-containing protein [Bifidobacteriaceae bacterium]|nr:PH domain-containing protein [Bifidobacteriaceae bacterium]
MADSCFTYRPRSGPAAALAIWALAALALVSLASARPGDLIRWGPAVACVCLAAWAVFWAPDVRVDEDAVTVRNVAASHRVPWAAIARIDTKWALTLFTAQGRVTAFAAPAPSSLRRQRDAPAEIRHLPESTFDAGRSVRPGDLPGTASGDLAWVVRERWEATRDAGPTGAASGERITRRWHTRRLAALSALAALAVLAPLVF